MAFFEHLPIRIRQGTHLIARESTNPIEAAIGACMNADQRPFRRRLRRIRRQRQRRRPVSGLQSRLEADIARSRARREARRRDLPRPEFPADLPIVEHRREIADAIREHQVVVVCGETGSGKSTQLPKMCLEAGRGVAGLIGHTQPRRIAARSIAARIARELNTNLGDAVGYKVRFSDRTRRDAFIKVMTDGILLAETQGDRELSRYDTIIIDEAHERSLNVDFLLGYLRQLLPRRPDLKLIITSATIDPKRFSEHFGRAPIIEVSGRMYPVDVRYRPLESEDPDELDRDLQQGILDAVDELAAAGGGDVLVFLAGERDIREAAEALRKHHPPKTEVLPLFARLSAAEQNRVFESHGGRRIVLATNVAETSLTVPGIRGVVDPGLARISRYSSRRKVQRLPVEPISQASARQRAGRCGRLGPGVCIRLYRESDYEEREPYTQPEILRTNLASVILQMKALKLGDVAAFPFIDAPRKTMIRDGYETLRELGALDERDRLNDLGRRLARLPIDPRIGRMILAADDEDCLTEVLVIASALSVQDPRERPMDQPDAADAAHALFADERSDFLTYLRLWDAYHEQKRHLSQNKLRRWCRDHFLSFMRMREWYDIHQQLRILVTEIGMRPNEEEADEKRIHCALLAGLLSNVARRGERHEYDAARGGKCRIFPGSVLFREEPAWIMAAEMVETTHRYARCVAPVRVDWIERIGAHLLRRTHSQPHWHRRTAQVMVFQRATLYGLEIINRRRVPYGPIEPEESRDIFIHQALVEGQYETNAPFLEHNRRLIEEIRDIEARKRKRDVLVDVEAQYKFYDKRLGPRIFSGRGFERWRSRAERGNPRLLFMARRDLMLPGAETADPHLFPDELTIGELRLPLEYRLEPGTSDDGVTLTAPVALLNQLPAARLEWLVPGLLKDKIVALIKSLPKDLRRNFVPAPDFAEACLDRLTFGEGSLREALGAILHRITGTPVPIEAWSVEELDDYLRMNIRVVDDEGAVIGSGRDLEDLRRQFGATARASFAQLADDRLERENITTWDFGPLPEQVEVNRGGMTLAGYPALIDCGESVALRVLDSPHAARSAMRGGLRRLFVLECGEDLAVQVEHLPGFEDLRRHYALLGDPDGLVDELVLLIADRAFIGEDDQVRSADAFERRLNEGWQRLWAVGCDVAEIVGRILRLHREVQVDLEALHAPVWADHVEDIRRHLGRLMPNGFLMQTPYRWLLQYPRYLKAIARRIEKLTNQGRTKDSDRAAEMNALWAQYAQRRADHEARGVHDPALEEYRWLLEEMRISLFAQELGTAVPVSPKRLESVWKKVQS
ncbi:MAG: ATP-dependent RNA helicase HrpA [Planctomycetota bacterium]|nr:ATP-dependent RNA helicase HrpA [Planctomycetota bacterium]